MKVIWWILERIGHALEWSFLALVYVVTGTVSLIGNPDGIIAFVAMVVLAGLLYIMQVQP